MNGYLSVKEAAGRWNITERQVQRLCAEGRIPGVIQFVGSWAIPEDAPKPTRPGKLKPGPKPKNKDGKIVRGSGVPCHYAKGRQGQGCAGANMPLSYSPQRGSGWSPELKGTG
jgi:hypothetical protein